MASFRDYSIRRKLMVITMVTSGVVLVLGSVGFVAADFVTFRRRVVADLYGLAQMIEVNAATGLIFNDRQTAAQLLGALKAQPRILQGANTIEMAGASPATGATTLSRHPTSARTSPKT